MKNTPSRKSATRNQYIASISSNRLSSALNLVSPTLYTNYKLAGKFNNAILNNNTMYIHIIKQRTLIHKDIADKYFHKPFGAHRRKLNRISHNHTEIHSLAMNVYAQLYRRKY